ncbi:MAG: hypothetical protein CL769_03510 [Chloroflexi bacterium]|nr:hypothetical protein [Chloroflexota bacterium]|tara:strand:+ start:144 stop:590 length:447 start_codon:yes stop_codon:yes gene_type:complete
MKNQNIYIPKKIIGEIISHALNNDPNESCGILQGKGSTTTKFHQLKNIHEAPQNRYTIDPVELMNTEKICDEENESIIGIMHSHTHTQAYPSETDVKNALTSGYLEQIYIIVSLVEKTRPIVKAFSINNHGEVSEIYIDFDGPKYISR